MSHTAPSKFDTSIGVHLAEARKRGLQVFFFGLLTFLVCLYFSPQILKIFQYPYLQLTNAPLNVSNPLDVFNLLTKSANIATMLIVMPFANYHILAFAIPGLMPQERVIAIAAFVLVPVMLVALLAVVYYAVLPVLLGSLLRLTVENAIINWELSAYIVLLMRVTFITTILLPVPLAAYFVIPRPFTFTRVKLLLLTLFVISAVITPGGMLLADAGLTLLFALSLGISLLYLKYFTHALRRKKGSASA